MKQKRRSRWCQTYRRRKKWHFQWVGCFVRLTRLHRKNSARLAAPKPAHMTRFKVRRGNWGSQVHDICAYGKTSSVKIKKGREGGGSTRILWLINKIRYVRSFPSQALGKPGRGGPCTERVTLHQLLGRGDRSGLHTRHIRGCGESEKRQANWEWPGKQWQKQIHSEMQPACQLPIIRSLFAHI